eukprot:1210942-Pyramimonas_sp.AAC.1
MEVGPQRRVLTCTTLSDSMQCARHGHDAARIEFSEFLHVLPLRVTGRSVSLSSGCSGILTFDLSARIVGKELAFNVTSEWALEHDGSAISEILCGGPDSPRHLFHDWYDMLPSQARNHLRAMPLADVDARRALILRTPTRSMARCL